ncbi:SDR family oxidoreductase [Actibacterium lipolyticum]|uniref:3-oxoacyl-[acyl-carrier-protein] reductase FabG n=1 Tax=Actibacterium lipolyticum TaxID=1524263 RepID=A0A238KRV6_9RHOB|nr:SDR family NAD(P)-dependent oxidoreductase [Actibacterium lipolyticum]SMX45545.1 3-oxoacyl-[acyl-carrier-protein] reductase FabG [Actibacterium lipolyticum]
MAFDLSNRTVLLTGATRGIGREMLHLLLARNAKVLAVARSEAALTALEAAYPDKVFTLTADLASPDMPRAIARWVADQHPDCSVLINNAAVMKHTYLTDVDPRHETDITTEVAVNLTAPIQLCAMLLPTLMGQPNAAIVNVTSGLAIAPITNAATYCATKAALRHFTKALRYQCQDAKADIQVTEAVMALVDTTLSHGDPAMKLPPAKAAAEVIAGLEAGKDEIWIEKTKLLRRVWRLSPSLAEGIMRRRTPA